MRRIYLVYWYWMMVGGFLGLGLLALLAGGWLFLLVGLLMAVVGRLFHVSIRLS